MGLIEATVISILGGASALVVAVITRLITDDIKEWLPWVRERLIERAVNKLPEDQRERYGEEWRSHINETPGDLSKLVVALGAGTASRSISNAIYSGDPLSVSDWIEDVVRRVFDITMSLTVLFLCAPSLIFAMLVISLSSPGPIFVRHKRVGKNGRVFWMMRLRTMSMDAALLGGILDPSNAQKITRIGKFLRQSRVDELPALFNVLRGDMGFVGPYPEHSEISEELANQIPEYLHRNQVKPGLTGLAQVRYPYGASFDDISKKLQQDKFYLMHRSLWLDVRILIWTLRAVLWPNQEPPA